MPPLFKVLDQNTSPPPVIVDHITCPPVPAVTTCPLIPDDPLLSIIDKVLKLPFISSKACGFVVPIPTAPLVTSDGSPPK